MALECCAWGIIIHCDDHDVCRCSISRKCCLGASACTTVGCSPSSRQVLRVNHAVDAIYILHALQFYVLLEIVGPDR